MRFGQFSGLGEEEVEQAPNRPRGPGAFPNQLRRRIDALHQKLLQAEIGRPGSSGQEGQAGRVFPHFLHVRHAATGQRVARPFDKPRHEQIDQPAQNLLKLQPLLRGWKTLANLIQQLPVMRNGSRYFVEGKKSGGVRIIEVGAVVGDLIGKIDQLRFHGWAQPWQILIELGHLTGSKVVRVLDDALAHLKG